jgi:hypothetical protein
MSWIGQNTIKGPARHRVSQLWHSRRKNVRKLLKIADEPVSRILCAVQMTKSLAPAAIIPLGHDSHRDSSSLPEGSPLSQLALQQRELALIEPGRLSPPIWPCTTRGFPCLVCLQTSGGLLPHRFTLTCRTSISKTSCRFPCSMPPCSIPPAVYFLWHFP